MHDKADFPSAGVADQFADWFSAFGGVFSFMGPICSAEAPAFNIWSGTTTIVSVSCCQNATLLRMPRVMGGKLLDHFGLRFVLSGQMKVGEGSGQEVATAGDGFFIDLSQPLRMEYAGQDAAVRELTLWAPRRMASLGFVAPGGLHARIFRKDQPAASIFN